MIRVEPYAPDHLAMIEVQPGQREALHRAEVYFEAGPAWTAFDEAGVPIFVGGFARLGPSYMHAWCVMSARAGHALWAITAITRRLIANGGWRRVEMMTDARFEQANRWAKLLGFELEGVRRAAMADGGDMLVWARIGGENVGR